MKEDIKTNINNPKELEKLYRTDKEIFKREFNSLYPELNENKLADFWNERLNYESSEISYGSKSELKTVFAASFIACLIAEVPSFLPVDREYFYTRNISFIVFPLLIFYFGRKNKLSFKKSLFVLFVILFSLVFINLMPDNKSDTLILSCIHLPLFLWFVLGYTYSGEQTDSSEKRLDYLRYNGDLTVITAIILIAGFILTGITIGLFSLIDLKIEGFYKNYILICGLAVTPIAGTYIVQTNPQLVNKVSPLIARMFCPLILITLVVYLTAIIVTGKDPYNDREFLLLFNGLLILVMAVIIFSAAESSRSERNRTEILILFLLSAVTIIVNVIALSAILFRISEWGITPNRTAVLGSNILILINLLLVTIKLFRTLRNKCDLSETEKAISAYLPVYFIWSAAVTFIFPVVFGF